MLQWDRQHEVQPGRDLPPIQEETMTLKEIRVIDLYDLMDELDAIMRDYGFNAKPHAYRTGVKRMRCYLDHVASGLRMVKGGEFEPHNIQNIHRHNRNYE